MVHLCGISSAVQVRNQRLLNPALESINVDFQHPVPQNIWRSAWCLVLPTSSGPKSAWRTRCEIQCLPLSFCSIMSLCPILSLSSFLFFVWFFFWFHTLFFFPPLCCPPRPPSLSGELNASILSVCLPPISLVLSIVLVLFIFVFVCFLSAR